MADFRQPWNGMPVAAMRASHADRERAVDVLKAAYFERRLTEPEYEQRIELAYQASTWGGQRVGGARGGGRAGAGVAGDLVGVGVVDCGADVAVRVRAQTPPPHPAPHGYRMFAVFPAGAEAVTVGSACFEGLTTISRREGGAERHTGKSGPGCLSGLP